MMSEEPPDDTARLQELARRYRCEFIDLHKGQLRPDIFSKVPVDLMFRYNFVALEETPDGRVIIAVADPSQLMMIDEISLLLGKRIVTKVASSAQINEILHRFDEGGIEENPDADGAPVLAPLKPKPHPRSGGATAVPEPNS